MVVVLSGQDGGASDKSDRAFVPSASSPQAVSPVPASIPSAKRDHNVREHHGCTCIKGNVVLVELANTVKISADFHSEIRPQHMRYLARKLYHLARKIERRDAQAIEARRAETLGSVEDESAVPEGNAP